MKADDDAGLPDEMFKMATAGIDYKKVFNARGVIVPAGEHEALAQQQSNDVRPKVILDAKQYVKDNPKQFVGMDVDAATARAVYLHATGEIKFAGE